VEDARATLRLCLRLWRREEAEGDRGGFGLTEWDGMLWRGGWVCSGGGGGGGGGSKGDEVENERVERAGEEV